MKYLPLLWAGLWRTPARTTLTLRSIVEIATLRVFDFGAAAILTSVFAQALVLSLLGAAVGAWAAGLAFNNDLHAAGSLVFRLTVTPALMVEGIGLAFMLGLLGGVLPALRAVRVPVAGDLMRLLLE